MGVSHGLAYGRVWGVPQHPGKEPWGLRARRDQQGCWAGTGHHLSIWETSCPSGSLQPGRKLGLLAKSRLPCLLLPPCCGTGQVVA